MITLSDLRQEYDNLQAMYELKRQEVLEMDAKIHSIKVTMTDMINAELSEMYKDLPVYTVAVIRGGF
jgi:hypothetical protein